MTSTDTPPVLTKLTRQMHTLLASYLDHLGIGTGQALILREVIYHYGVTQDQVSALLKLDKSTVARAVKRLVEAGYVEKKRNPRDRRSHNLLSTNLARVLKPQFEMVDESLAEVLLMDFPKQDIEQFGNYLRRASANVHHVLHSPPENKIHRLMKFYDI